MNTRVFAPLVMSLLLLLAACGPDEHATQSEPATDARHVAIADEVDGVRTFTIKPVGNDMRFEQTEITASAGETIRVVFDNIATSPAMHHNVLFVTDSDVINEVGQAAMSAAANNYIPDHPAVIASTPMATPGETVEVTFTVPGEAGEYPFICTYPGHYLMMQGTLIVMG